MFKSYVITNLFDRDSFIHSLSRSKLNGNVGKEKETEFLNPQLKYLQNIYFSTHKLCNQKVELIGLTAHTMLKELAYLSELAMTSS